MYTLCGMSPRDASCRFYGAAQDITERRITRAALEEHQTALNKAQELARMASFVWDVRDKAVTWSEKMYSLLGIDRNELTEDIVDTYIQLVHPEDRERVHRQITEMIETRESHRMEFRVIRPNGEERILQSDSDYVLDEDGLVAKAIGLHWDVTEQRLAEQALRSSEARLRLMVENLPARRGLRRE